MKPYFMLLLLAAILFGTETPAFATVSKATILIQTTADEHPKTIATMSLREFQRLAGRKLSFREKLGFLVLRHKMRHSQTGKERLGEASLILGFTAVGLLVAGLFAPPLIIVSFVTSIFAIVTGTMKKKEGGDDRKAAAGKLMGWVTLSTILFLLGLATILYASLF